jgi:hypothetical protein
LSDLTFLADKNYTTKDKLVLLTAQTMGTDNASAIATALGSSVSSVRQSLAKAGQVDPAADASGVKALQAAIVAACEMHTPSMRPSDWRLVAKVAADLHEAGATPDEVERRARNLSRRFHLWPTPGSLDKYWAQLADAEHPFSPRAVYG